MKLRFYGADKEVTGSCHLLEVRGKKILMISSVTIWWWGSSAGMPRSISAPSRL